MITIPSLITSNYNKQNFSCHHKLKDIYVIDPWLFRVMVIHGKDFENPYQYNLTVIKKNMKAFTYFQVYCQLGILVIKISKTLHKGPCFFYYII